MSIAVEPLVYSLKEVANMFGKSTRQITRWEDARKFPRRVSGQGEFVKYDRAEVDAWFDARHRRER
jgi:predicted DNA-binding transcriptional regulator AlpA